MLQCVVSTQYVSGTTVIPRDAASTVDFSTSIQIRKFDGEVSIRRRKFEVFLRFQRFFDVEIARWQHAHYM